MPESPHPPDLQNLLAHADWVAALARELAQNPAQADDIAQQTWLAALEKPPSKPERPRPWLARVLRNFLRMEQRGSRNRGRREAAAIRRRDSDPALSGDSPDQIAARMETVAVLAKALVALPKPYRETVYARFYEGLTQEQIAARSSVSRSEVRRRLARGLELLRREVAPELGDAWRQRCQALASPLLPLAAPAQALRFGHLTAAGVVTGLLAFLGWMWIPDSAWAPPLEPDASTRLLAESAVTSAAAPAPRMRSEAQVPVSGPATSPMITDPEQLLAGVVLDSRTQPISGARVRIERPPHRYAPRVRPFQAEEREVLAELVTDQDGRFSISLEPGRTFDLAVSAGGFGTMQLPNRYPGAFLRVVLTPAAEIRGVVVDAETGLGVPYAEVSTKRGVIHEPGQQSLTATADASGNFALAELPAGEYQVRSHATGYAVNHRPAGVQVRPGETVSLELPLDRGARVFGVIRDARTGQALSGATVRTQARTLTHQVMTDEMGRYALDGLRPSDEERLSVTAPGYGQYDWTVTHPIPPEGLELNLGLLPGRTLRGRLVDPSGQPIADAYLAVSAWARRPEYGDVQAEECFARSGSDGSFEVDNLRVDLRHSLRIAAAGFGSEVFDLPASEWESDLLELGQLVLFPEAHLSGVVRHPDGQPRPGIWVTLQGATDRRDELGPASGTALGYVDSRGYGLGSVLARTDARGRYYFDSLPAGEYRLWAGAKGFARGAEAQIRLGPGQRETLDLVLDPGLGISGVVVDPAGRPISGASVSVFPQGANLGRLTYALTDGLGRFSVCGLDAGRFTLWCQEGFHAGVDAHGQPCRFVELWSPPITAGQTEVRLQLTRAVRTEGQVQDEDGQPVPGAVVCQISSTPGGGAVQPLAHTDSRGAFTCWLEENTTSGILVFPAGRGPDEQLRQTGLPVDLELGTSGQLRAGTTGNLVQLRAAPD